MSPPDTTHPPGGGPPPPSGDTFGGDPQPHPSGLPSDARGWAIGAHLGGLGVGILSVAMLGFLAPLLVWLVKREDHPFIDHHAKEALNFQLTVVLAIVVGTVAAIPVAILGLLTIGIGWIVAAIVVVAAAVAWFVLPIVAAVKASNGEGYRYPVTIRFIG